VRVECAAQGCDSYIATPVCQTLDRPMGEQRTVFWTLTFLYNTWLSDVETCFKMAPTDVWRALHITSGGFGFEAEVTGKFLAAAVASSKCRSATRRGLARKVRSWIGPTVSKPFGSN
jgi:hypothetical protein